MADDDGDGDDYRLAASRSAARGKAWAALSETIAAFMGFLLSQRFPLLKGSAKTK